MANGTEPPQYEPEPEEQLDEFGEPIPTQAQMENERSKTDQVLKLVGAQASLEGQLPNQLPTQAAPVDEPPFPMRTPRIEDAAPFPMRTTVAQPPPLTLPVSRGRMYMGPALSAPEEAAFMRSPSPTSINLMPAPVGPPPSRLARAQALDRPGTRTISIRDEAPYSDATVANAQNMARFEALQNIRSRQSKGEAVTPMELAMLFGVGKGLPASSMAMTPSQAANYGLQRERLDMMKKNATEREARLSKPKPTRAVLDTYESLQKAQMAYQVQNDFANARKAQIQKDEFVRQHPELGLQPELSTSTGTAVAAPTAAAVRITSKEQFDKLAPGTEYIGKDGKRYRKP